MRSGHHGHRPARATERNPRPPARAGSFCGPFRTLSKMSDDWIRSTFSIKTMAPGRCFPVNALTISHAAIVDVADTQADDGYGVNADQNLSDFWNMLKSAGCLIGATAYEDKSLAAWRRKIVQLNLYITIGCQYASSLSHTFWGTKSQD